MPHALAPPYQHSASKVRRRSPVSKSCSHCLCLPYRYTLTHNDLTAQLHLAIGDDFNTSQISGWCGPHATRMRSRCHILTSVSSRKSYFMHTMSQHSFIRIWHSRTKYKHHPQVSYFGAKHIPSSPMICTPCYPATSETCATAACILCLVCGALLCVWTLVRSSGQCIYQRP